MKILIVSQYFFPEEFKINDLAESLVLRGHSVTVLTGKPNYPFGSFFTGYRFWGIHKEEYKGVSVIRVPLIRRGKGGPLRLVFNYLSYVFFANWYVRIHKCNYDSVFIWETSPITQAYPGIIAAKKAGARLSMWVQDLWPESVSATIGLKNQFILSWLNRIVTRVYSKCDTIFVQSMAFKESICSKGDFESRIVFAPNWAEDVFVRESLINRDKFKLLIPNGFRVMFAGNIGEAQDFRNIVRAAALTRSNKVIHWVIVGDGRMRSKTEEVVREKGLTETVHFIGRFPVEDMPSVFCHADAMLVSLKDEYIFSLTIPSKIQAYMAFGKPIITMMCGEGNRVVEESGCGITAQAGDFTNLAHNVELMCNMSKTERDILGRNGVSYYKQNFDKKAVIDLIEKYL